MWPLKLDMSRDECKKCLRCLELDAYGNMVSVLRAQGSFTCEKQKLLQELAKVLHISNERHRAEIRRAVNDEKLTTIAEQLSGPNTGTNWAIEGRRMIPLLPRMKACTVYTGLANSLSLVTSAANEKKPSTNRERINDVKVKVEAESRTELELEEKSPPNISASQPEGRFNNRKRKRSLLEASDNEGSIIALSNGERNKVETIAISTSRVDSNSPTPISIPPPDKVVIVSPPSEANIDRHSRGSVTNMSRFTTSASHHQNLTVVSLGNSSIGSSSTVSPVSVISQSSMYSHLPIQPSRHLGTTVNTYATATAKTKPTAVTAQSKANPRTAIDLPSSSTQYADEKSPVYEAHEAQQSSDKCGKIVSISSDTRRASSRCENKVANHNSSCTRRVTSVTHSSTISPKSLSLSNGPRVMTISSDSTASSGPGPPHIKTNPTVLTCNKLPAAKLNHQSTAKMGITLNSDKIPINVTPNAASARLATKTNVIVVQKGHTRGVTLSHAGKEVLGKVIMGGKNFCLSNQQNASSVSLLPHRVAANGDQACMTMLSSLSTSQSESARSHSKSGNMIVFDLRPDDVIEKSKFLSQFLEASGVFNSESKTGTLKPNSQLLTKESGKINNSPTIGKYTQSKDDATGGTITEQNEHRCNKKDTADTAVKEIDEALSIKSVGSRGTPDGSEEPSERQGVLDPQTGIYSFQSSDNAVNSMEIEGPISNTEIDIFSTALASADINLETFEYAEDEESNKVMEEARNQILNIDRLNELYE